MFVSDRRNKEKIDKLSIEAEMIRRDISELTTLVATIADLVAGLYVNLKNEKERKEENERGQENE